MIESTMTEEKKRVVVAMSGGVDSSVAAALLAEAGHEVIGVTLQLYDHGAAIARAGSCCAGRDIHDARAVAAALDIPHYVLDYEARFKEAVIKPFAASYAAGETPIPCVACNQEIKFKDLYAMARELGADILATGHYIARRESVSGPTLHRAADAARDQSYFLFATSREQLETLWFPIGAMTKSEVRAHARRFGLPVAEKADSQDICFVPYGRYTDIVARLEPDARRTGDIVHVDGRRLGQHEGIAHFTVGQRRGLGIASGEPLFVIRIDAPKNEIVVGPRESLRTGGVLLRDINWLGDRSLPAPGEDGLAISARIRSSQKPQPALIATGENGRTRVLLQTPENGVAAGQACVFYDTEADDARLLGGGVIECALGM